MKEISVALIVKDKKILMEKRRTDKIAYPGMWGFPGGRIKEGEKSFEALKRELKEELGIEVNNAMQCSSFSDIEPISGEGIRFTVFIVKNWKGEIEKSAEADEIGWFTKEEISNMNVPAVMLLMLRCLKKIY